MHRSPTFAVAVNGPARCNRCRSTDGSQPGDVSSADEQEKKKGSLPKILKPLTDFGVGKSSVWEGGVGLFVVVGVGALPLP